MTRGRKPVPAEERRRRGEEVTELPTLVGGRARPPMPPGLTDRMKTAWRIVVDDLEAAGILDRADWAVIEAFAVAVGRAREARVLVNKEGIMARNSQGRVTHPALRVEQDSWREVRQLADQLPLSPWGRARLGMKRADPTDELERTLGPAPRFQPTVLDGGLDAADG